MKPSQEFNIAIAERVMGWDETVIRVSGYDYKADNQWWRAGPDFIGDHNAAALVRERIVELKKEKLFLDCLAQITGIDWMLEGFGYEDMMGMLQATPEQTASAAYLAVTGEELEAIDE